MVTVPAARDGDPDGVGEVTAPLVDAAVEPRPARWAAADEVVDAEVVEAPQQVGATGAAPGLRWPCSCGTEVLMEHTTCPVCGSEFLGGLRSEDSGRHRRGPGAIRGRSRTVRLCLAGLVAVAVAVVIPVLLTLIG
jgi:hypothetical protein